jgi:hypothetical protein
VKKRIIVLSVTIFIGLLYFLFQTDEIKQTGIIALEEPNKIDFKAIEKKIKEDGIKLRAEISNEINITQKNINSEYAKLDKLFEMFETGDLYDTNKMKLMNEFTKDKWIIGYEDKFFSLLNKILNTQADDKNWVDTGDNFPPSMVREQLKRDIMKILKNSLTSKFSHPDYPKPEGGYPVYYEKIADMFIELVDYEETKKQGLMFISSHTSDEKLKDFYYSNKDKLSQAENEMVFNIRAVNDLMSGDDPYIYNSMKTEIEKYADKEFLKGNLNTKLALYSDVVDDETKEKIRQNETIRDLLQEKPKSNDEVSFVLWLRSLKVAYYEKEYVDFLNNLFVSLTFNEKYWLIKKMTADFFQINNALNYLNEQANLIVELSKSSLTIQEPVITIVFMFDYAHNLAPTEELKSEVKDIINNIIILRLDKYPSNVAKDIVAEFKNILNPSDTGIKSIDW